MDSPDIISFPQNQVQIVTNQETPHVQSSEIKVPLVDPNNRGSQRVAEKLQDWFNTAQDKLNTGKHIVVKVSELITKNPGLGFIIGEYTDDALIGSLAAWGFLHQHAIAVMPNLVEIVNKLISVA